MWQTMIALVPVEEIHGIKFFVGFSTFKGVFASLGRTQRDLSSRI
jgi:hypothetical protein